MPESPPWGFLNVDKPLGATSHDVVARIRRTFKLKKVGHAGTLDPLATGVLVICVGAATRLSEYVMQSSKRYRAQMHLGVTTDTYDAEGTVIAERDASHVTREEVERALAAFLGDIDQLPPMYSAVKQGGRKLYELARAGQTVEREARAVVVESLAITDWSPPLFTLEVVCSAGTYVRSLAHDLGEALGVGAHLAGLVRLASGTFTLENAVALDTLLNESDWQRNLIPPDAPLTAWPAVHLDVAGAECVLRGQPIPQSSAAPGTLARAYGPDGAFIAILQAGNGAWQPHKVFLPRI